MNIQELDAYNLGDAVKFNDRLNPRLWDKSEHLRDDVRAQLLLIAEDFRETLGVKDLDLQDITISGSNAAYTYTPNSDIDLHLVVAMPEDPVYRELFDAKKFQYNETHNIKIGGYDVELYVQAADQPHYSQGIYSVLNNDWIQVPRRAKAEVDDASTRNKFETIGHQIEAAIKSGDSKRLDVMARKIKRMRQTGLEQHGEFGPENLAFKILRSQGVLQKLHNARAQARSQELSLKEQPAQPRFTWGFQTEDAGLTWDGVNPTTCMFLNEEDPKPTDEEILQDFVDFCARELNIDELPVMKLRRDPQWPVVNKTFGRYRNDREMLEVAWGNRHIMDVLRTVAHELTHRHQHERDGDSMDHTAGETGSPWENEANARAGILMRDYARLHPDYFEAGQTEEHIDEGVRSNAAAAAVVAALSGAAPAQAQVQDIIGAVRDIGSIALAAKKITRAGLNAEVQQELNNYLSVSGDRNSRNLSVIYQLQQRLEQQADQPQGQPLPGYTQQSMPPDQDLKEFAPSPEREDDDIPNQLVHLANRWWNNAEKQPQIENVLRSLGWSIHQVESEDDAVQLQHRDGTTYFISADDFDPEIFESASGYIPTKKQARDPRFSTALTVDIHPGQLGKEANKLKLKTNRQGQPQQLRADGLFEELKLQLEAFKKGQLPKQPLSQVPGEVEDDLGNQEAMGPEFPPQWPEGTTKVDVSDLTDWYRLGMDISDMDDADPADYNQGPPQTVVVFPSDEMEQGYLQQLKRLGLKTHDMDPDVKGGEDVTGKHLRRRAVAESEDLDEVKMSPKALKKFADSPAAKGIMVGFEAEMIFPNVRVEDMDPELEPDYNADERAYSLDHVIEFFQYDEWGYGLSDREADRLRERLDEAYYEWYDDQMLRDFGEEAEDYIKKVLVDDGDWDEDEEIQKQLYLLDLSDDEINNIINAGERAPKFTSSKEQQEYSEANPDYKKYLDAQEEAQDLLDTLIQDEVGKQGANWDAALDDFRDNYQLDDDSGFFSDLGWRWMSDIANEFNLSWPYVTDVNSSEGEMDIDSVAESLADVIGMPVVASYSYHGAKRKPGEFIIEPDGSLSPDSSEDGGLEIISPPMPIEQAMEKLNQVIEWAQQRGCYTNSSTGLHMGVSLPGQKSFAEADGDVESAPVAEKPIDFMKLALFLGDQYVLKEFERQANSYTASALKKLKERRWSPQQIATAMEKMRSNLINLAYKDLADRSPGRDSINMKDNYVEFRGAGGDYLSKESDQGMDFLENTLLRYVQALAIAGDPTAYRDEYAKKLYKLISPSGDDTLNLFSQFATGEIDKEKLKTEWARKTLEKDDPSAVNKGNWVVIDNNSGKKVQGQEYNGYTQDEVRVQAKQKISPASSDIDFDKAYSIHSMETGKWEIYRDDHGQDETLEIISADRRGEAVDKAWETYNGVIPFKVRAYYGDEAAKPEPTRRAKLAKQIIQKPKQPKDYNYEIVNLGDVNLGVVDKFYATNKQDADATFDKWLEMKGLPNDTSNYGYRPRKQEKEVDVAQNFAPSTNPRPTIQEPNQARASNGVPIWDLVDRGTGNVINSTADHTAREAWGQFTRYLTDIGAEDPATFDQRFTIRAQTAPQDATEQEGTWQIFDATLRQPVETFQGTWAQAARIADQYAIGPGERNGHEISVRRAQ